MAATTPKKTVFDIRQMKGSGDRITMLTAYDFGTARILDSVGIDIVLVGDSLGMVVLGYESTVPVTMDEMIHHTKAVKRGVSHALLVGDMPFLSYQAGMSEAIGNAGRFLKEAGCDAVKLEGGIEMADTIRALTKAGIPVMGHIGLTPQTAGQLGGYKVQGKDLDSARKVLADAEAVTEAGAFALVLECIPDSLAELITGKIAIPTIGIGAGAFCDGQVLVTHDLIGVFEKFTPRFVKTYANLAPEIRKAIEAFKKEVKTGSFPAKEHSFVMAQDIRKLLDDKEER